MPGPMCSQFAPQRSDTLKLLEGSTTMGPSAPNKGKTLAPTFHGDIPVSCTSSLLSSPLLLQRCTLCDQVHQSERALKQVSVSTTNPSLSCAQAIRHTVVAVFSSYDNVVLPHRQWRNLRLLFFICSLYQSQSPQANTKRYSVLSLILSPSGGGAV